jgi:nucleoid DNA-binding protein
MRKPQWLALGGLVASFGLIFVLAAQAQAPRKDGPAPAPVIIQGQGQPSKQQMANLPLPRRIAAETKLTEEQVNKVLEALGPAVRDALARGQQIELPGLGTFRVVRVPQHRDLVNGRPATISGVNSVEFLPVGDMVSAANSDNAVPNEVVPPFEYNPLPNQVKGQRVGEVRMPNIRTR